MSTKRYIYINKLVILRADIFQTAEYAGNVAAFIDETDRKYFWTINRRILACMLGTYFCQSPDKGTLGFSSTMGIKPEAHLAGNDYS
jgi:hypothetical protein